MPQSPLTKFAVAAALALGVAGLAQADPAPAGPPPYPNPAPMEQYRMTVADEIAMARSAAPESVSKDAEVLTLGAKGYETGATGTNGFVCMVQRAWASGFGDDGFWNPRLRGPICFNAAAARSVLPVYLERTGWVLAGASKAEMEARTKAAVAADRYPRPAVGAMAIMTSKRGYLGDEAGGPWHPHLMMFFAPDAGGTAAWAANLPGSPVIGAADDIEPVTTFFVPVRKWSDGTWDIPGAATPAMAGMPNPQ